jgi:hypothetical protein
MEWMTHIKGRQPQGCQKDYGFDIRFIWRCSANDEFRNLMETW